jgi:hypothetical protein
MSQGFTYNRCTGNQVDVNDVTLPASDIFDENIILTSSSGPSQLGLVYPDNNKLKLASGKYSLSLLVEKEVTIQPSTFEADNQKQTISVNKQGGNYKGSYLVGSYNDFAFGFTLDELKAAKKIIFYVPVETTQKSFAVSDINYITQPDGSFYKKGLIDDDCNPSTPDKEVEINVSRKEVGDLLRPRLQ